MDKHQIIFMKIDLEFAAADLPHFEGDGHIDRIERARLNPTVGAP
jgi:hypothetical protein